MAKQKCIPTLLEVEHRSHLVLAFCEAVDELAGAEPPLWLPVLWQLAKDLERDVAAHGAAVRAA